MSMLSPINKVFGGIIAIVLFCSDTLYAQKADWLKEAKWGIFIHFLGSTETQQEWNKLVDSFNVTYLTEQLDSIGAGYVIFTVGQISGHYCSPNDFYERTVGTGKCSKRDLIKDLALALQKKNIPLIVYVPSDAPRNDTLATQRLRWFDGKNHCEFHKLWHNVLREWSLRWGTVVKGWWVDGVYQSYLQQRHESAPDLIGLVTALRSGNPSCVIALNTSPNVPIAVPKILKEYVDFTAGETDEVLPVPKNWEIPIQFHVAVYLGESWVQGKPRFPAEFVKGYTIFINTQKGVVSWGIPIVGNGRIQHEFIAILRNLKSLRETKK